MEYGDLKRILKDHDLRVTDCRLDVLDYFLTSGHAISTRELEAHCSQYDRVTLYRTLHSFTDQGVLHSIPDDSGYARYGVCHETCGPNDHHHNHVHFKCDTCGNLECLPEQHVPSIDLPHYRVKEANLILTGICPQCVTTG